MIIVCTHCKTGYQVDISKVKPEGIEFKCIKCNQFFLIIPKDIDHDQSRVQNNMDTEQTRYSEDDNLNTLVTSVVGDLKGYGDRLNSQLGKLSEIGIALSGVTDLTV